MKYLKFLFIFYLIGVLPACSSNISLTATLSPTTAAPQEIPGSVTSFSVLNDSIGQYRAEVNSIFISKNSKTHFPVKENGYWEMEDKYGHVTQIKQTNMDSNTVSFTIERIGGITNQITVSQGSIIFLFFADTRQDLADALNYDPTGDQFIDYPLIPFFSPPSSVMLIIWENGEIVNKKNYDGRNEFWCRDLGSNDIRKQINQDLTLKAYKLPGNRKTYDWTTECPKVMIEEVLPAFQPDIPGDLNVTPLPFVVDYWDFKYMAVVPDSSGLDLNSGDNSNKTTNGYFLILKVAYLSILDESIKKCYLELGYTPIGHKAGSYYPIKENNDWVFKDDYGQVTMIKNDQVIGIETTFEIERQGGRTSKISVSTGSIIQFVFESSSETYLYDLFFAPSVNEFVDCPANITYTNKLGIEKSCNSLPPEQSEIMCNDTTESSRPLCHSENPNRCFLPPSSIRLLIWHNGNVTKWFDEIDSGWCTKGLGNTAIEYGNPYFSTFYQLPGDETVYHWSEGDCPKVTIEELSE